MSAECVKLPDKVLTCNVMLREANHLPRSREEETQLTTHVLDAKGLRCPQPILTLITFMPSTSPGDIVELVADCATFEDDVRKWCDRMDKTLLAINRDGTVVTAQIQI